ncbi:MAG: hypothetical protein M9958_08590 [Chitinophagales bacterium]|nr:hypothetical protein [Chitinophagales bacterium]
MKNYKFALVLISLVVIIFVIGYLTYIFKKTGVPIHRHDEIYQIIQSQSTTSHDSLTKNYTEPFKKYGIIGVEEIEIDDYSGVVAPRQEENKLPEPLIKNE